MVLEKLLKKLNLKGYIMKKVFTLLPIVAVLAACGTTDPYDRIAERERERQEKLAERAVDRAPKWMSELPKSDNAVYANGSAISRDFSMADIKAKNIAYSKICMAAGGQVDQQTKTFIQDTEKSSVELSNTAIRSFCRGTDITGVVIDKIERRAEGPNIRTYVLVALPNGEANRLVRDRDQRAARQGAQSSSERAFRDLDNPARPAQ